MSVALSDGYFPVRWAPDLRYGEPIFNFYAPLPYYVGVLIHLFGANFIWTSKILFMLSAVLSCFAMYLFCSRVFNKRAGYLAAILYTYAPYRAVDMYVRGSLSETWSFIFFPLIFYMSYLLSQKRNVLNVSYLALSLAGLFLTHNVTTLMFLPFLGIWWVYLIFKEKNLKIIPYLIFAFILGFGLSAFFLLPALLEKDFIQTKYLIVGYFNFRAHFVAVYQSFSTFWGYGSSLWGLDDGLSFQVGLVNWAILVVTGILVFIHRKEKKLLLMLGFLGISFIFSLFLQHNKSAFVWEAIPLMAFIQFPWRFLAITVFISAIIGAAITPYLKGRLNILYFVLIIASFVLTYQYFRPKDYVDDTFFRKFLSVESMRKGEDLTKDYLPIWVQKTSEENVLSKPESKLGQIEVVSFSKKTDEARAEVKVLKDAEIVAPITYFPGWEVLANGKKIDQMSPSELGLIRFNLPVGDYKLEFKFADTPVRMIGNLISFVSAVFLAAFLIFKKALKT